MGPWIHGSAAGAAARSAAGAAASAAAVRIYYVIKRVALRAVLDVLLRDHQKKNLLTFCGHFFYLLFSNY